MLRDKRQSNESICKYKWKLEEPSTQVTLTDNYSIIFLLRAWTLASDLDPWTRSKCGQDDLSCQISTSKVILFESFVWTYVQRHRLTNTRAQQ